MNNKNKAIRNFINRINTQKLHLIIKSIKWDIVIIIIATTVFGIIRIMLMSEIYPVNSKNTISYTDVPEDNFSFSIYHKDNYSYQESRDIFNFSNIAKHPSFTETKSKQEKSIPAEDNEQLPSLYYKGLIIMGTFKAAAFTDDQKEYTAIEGEIVEDKYKLLKIEPDFILILNIISNKQLHILAKDL